MIQNHLKMNKKNLPFELLDVAMLPCLGCEIDMVLGFKFFSIFLPIAIFLPRLYV
jgi:hypothetical protein